MSDDKVGVNDEGRRIGEGHPKAKLSDHEVDLMRELHEEFPQGHPEHKGYRWLCAKFDVARSTARDICKYRKRAQTVCRHKPRHG